MNPIQMQQAQPQLQQVRFGNDDNDNKKGTFDDLFDSLSEQIPDLKDKVDLDELKKKAAEKKEELKDKAPVDLPGLGDLGDLGGLGDLLGGFDLDSLKDKLGGLLGGGKSPVPPALADGLDEKIDDIVNKVKPNLPEDLQGKVDGLVDQLKAMLASAKPDSGDDQ